MPSSVEHRALQALINCMWCGARLLEAHCLRGATPSSPRPDVRPGALLRQAVSITGKALWCCGEELGQKAVYLSPLAAIRDTK